MESFMSFRFLAASSAALILALTPLAQAQTAAAPASAPAAAAPAPAAAPAATPAPAKATSGDMTEGKVAHYGRKFNGRKTASGERFSAGAMTMAHKTLPFGTLVKVTNLKNNRSVVVRVNDRGPSTPDRVGDLTTAAGKKIRMTRAGVVDAKLEVVGMSKNRMGKAGKAGKRMKAKMAK
jgi:rare lipoprotein A